MPPRFSGGARLAGEPAPPVTVADVKAEARRRIEAIMPRWMIDREVTGGDPVPTAAKAAAAVIRERSDCIEQLNPIPANFREDVYWAD